MKQDNADTQYRPSVQRVDMYFAVAICAMLLFILLCYLYSKCNECVKRNRVKKSVSQPESENSDPELNPK